MTENNIRCYSTQLLGLENVTVNSSFVEAAAVAVRVHRQNSRQGTLGCKDRTALVSRSNKKPWKQKGTGRARAGTARSPLWRGGAVSHGPQMRTRKLTLPRKMNHLALKGIFVSRLTNGEVWGIQHQFENTKQAAHFIKSSFGLTNRIVLLHDAHDIEMVQVFRNIPHICLLSYDAIHPYFLAQGTRVVFFEKDKDILNTTVAPWFA